MFLPFDDACRSLFENARDFLASVGVVYRENYLEDSDGELEVSFFWNQPILVMHFDTFDLVLNKAIKVMLSN